MLKKSLSHLLKYNAIRTNSIRTLSSTRKLKQADSSLSKLNYDQSLQEYADRLSRENGETYDQILNPSTNEPLSDPTQLVKNILPTTNTIKLKSSSTNQEVLIVFPSIPEDDKLRLLTNDLIASLSDFQASNRLNEIDFKIDEIDEKLLPMEEKYQQIVKKSAERTDNVIAGLLMGQTLVFFSIARLTWWEYSWDIMEPVAWAAQSGAMVFWGWYYFTTRSENTMTDLSNRTHNKKFMQQLAKAKFDVEEYNDLVRARVKLEGDYMKIKGLSKKE